MHECTSTELRAWCTNAIRRGADFNSVWNNVLKRNSLVCGQPRQRVQAFHPTVEVALATGERLVFDQSTQLFSLDGVPSQQEGAPSGQPSPSPSV